MPSIHVWRFSGMYLREVHVVGWPAVGNKECVRVCGTFIEWWLGHGVRVTFKFGALRKRCHYIAHIRARPCWRTDHTKEVSSVFSALSVNAPMHNRRFARQCIDGQSGDYALAHWRTKRRWRRKLPSYDPSVNIMAAPLQINREQCLWC